MTSPANRRTSSLLVLAVVALVAGLALWFAGRGGRPRESATLPPPAPAAQARDGATGTVADLERPGDLAQPAETEPRGRADVDPSHSGRVSSRVRGRVLDLAGLPVADAKVSMEGADPEDTSELARSGADGGFDFHTTKSELVLMASRPGLRTLRTQIWRSYAPSEGFVVVAPCADVQGSVVDEAGAPIQGARITVEVPATILAGFPRAPDGTQEAARWSQGCDERGGFVLKRACTVAGTQVVAARAGFLTARTPMPPDGRTPLRIVLARDPEAEQNALTGVVVRASGSPAERALVLLGDARAKCDERGAFRLLPPTVLNDDLPLVATESGSQAAVVPSFGRVVRHATEGLEPVRLVLGPEPLSIRGRVLDEVGGPLEGATVSLVDPVVVDLFAPRTVTAEGLVSGALVPVQTSANGAFEITGLSERDYRLQVFDRDRLGHLETDPIRAGANDVVIAFPADALVPSVRGRVVDRAGTPIAEAQLMALVTMERVGNSSSKMGRVSAQSRADGSFEFTDLPRRSMEITVRFSGEGASVDYVPRTIAASELDLSQPLEIVVDRLCAVRFEGLGSQTDLRWIAALDGAGRELQIAVRSNNSTRSTNRIQFAGDVVQLYHVSEAAAEFVLYYPYDTPVARRPVKLAPSGDNVVKW